MDLPVVLDSLQPRARDDLAAMAVAVQANLVALKVAWSRRIGIPSDRHDIRTPSPGAVVRFRDVLIDRAAIAALADDELGIRTRQVWGEFAALCWVFDHDDPHRPPDFSALPPDRLIHCPMHVQEKLATVQRNLWRLRFELRRRFDPTASAAPQFQAEHDAAQSIHVSVYGKNIRSCSNEDLLLCACEYSGMLAALRWASDARWAWEGPGILELAGVG